MQEIKGILLSRIKDIIELEQLEQKQIQKANERYNAIMRQKQGEQLRNIKQSNILLSMNNTKFENPSMFSYILPIVFQICTAYDSSIKIQEEVDQKIKLYKLLRNFFINNDFREKNSLLKSVFMRPYASVTEGIIFTWLSEWSKKKYLQILSLEIKNIKQKCILNQNALQQFAIQRHESIPFINNSEGNRSCSSRKSDLQTEVASSLTTVEPSILPTIDRSQKFISASVGQINSAKILTIYNRHTLYGYIVDEMSEYYKLTGIGSLDKNYVKSIRKRKLKEYLNLKQNLKRATQVIIQISANKQLRNLMKKYQSQYNIYRQERDKQFNPQKLQRYSNRSLKKTQKMTNEKTKTENVHSAQKRKQYTHNDQKKDQLNLKLTRIRSSSLFQAQELSQEKINAMRIQIKKELINKIQGNKSTQRKQFNFNMKLPHISRSFEKQHRSNEQIVERAKILRFPTQQQEQIQSNQSNAIINLPKFKFNQRQTIKGIIIKNFLSNREKIYKNKQKIEEEKKQEVALLNGLNGQGNKKINSEIEQHFKKAPEGVDIRSLRQKTNAILRNLRTIQHY